MEHQQRFRPLTLEQAQQMFLLGVALYVQHAEDYIPRSKHMDSRMPVCVHPDFYAVLEE